MPAAEDWPAVKADDDDDVEKEFVVVVGRPPAEADRTKVTLGATTPVLNTLELTTVPNPA
jgi:hypothetical protein